MGRQGRVRRQHQIVGLPNCFSSSGRTGQWVAIRIDSICSLIMNSFFGANPAAPPGGISWAVVT